MNFKSIIVSWRLTASAAALRPIVTANSTYQTEKTQLIVAKKQH